MKKSKSNHIWPAYVDMMTVLLLVYVLVSLLFAMMIKESIEAEYKEKLDNIISLSAEEIVENMTQVNLTAKVVKEDAEMKQNIEQPIEQESISTQAHNNEHEGNADQDSASVPQEEIVQDDHLDMLERRADDFTLPLVENQELLSQGDKDKLEKWYQANLSIIEKHGIDIGVIVKKNNQVSLGAVYRKQYMLYMDILRFLMDENKDFEPSNYIHRSPKGSIDIQDEYLLFRIKPEK